jgi:hypothetical protein
MNNSAQKHNTSTAKNISFSSINVKNTVRHIKFLSETELKLLTLILEESKLGKNGHDLKTFHQWANGSIGYLINRSKESVRIAKEGLQARGIILIDGLKWVEQTVEVDGKLIRTKTPYKQMIQLTEQFIAWFKDCVANRKIMPFRDFGYCDGYIIKKELVTMRSRFARLKYNAGKMLITVCNSCESVASGLVRGVTNPLGSFDKIQKNLNHQNTNLNTGYGFHSHEKESIKSKLRNPLLANLSSYTHKKVKIWTDSTTRICKQLIDSGMTQVEVARSMIHQNYVNSMQEFADKYSRQMNC